MLFSEQFINLIETSCKEYFAWYTSMLALFALSKRRPAFGR
jgi:hypothetical protein